MSNQRTLQYGIAAALGGDENTLNIQHTSGSISAPHLPFPPTDQALNLALNSLRSNKGNFPINAFIIYRELFLEYLKSKSQGVQFSDPSSVILDAWSKEPTNVKNFYSGLLCSNALNETSQTVFDSVMSPIEHPNSVSFSVQDENGYDFDLFNSGSSESIGGPPTPMSITNSPFDSSNIPSSENNANGRLFFPALAHIQRRPSRGVNEVEQS
ncbi:28620_t:CDS:2 [Racocetra persica]|uniref:28620_t:CDS:1 n=1 Tax=Racocetra persica TaxID=160502 RepID=A0ACA9KRD9_9GLOM|nr:28620_t:CDS:2 [Racocetra persica]